MSIAPEPAEPVAGAGVSLANVILRPKPARGAAPGTAAAAVDHEPLVKYGSVQRVVNDSEMHNLLTFFNKLNVSGNGSLSVAELQASMGSLGHKITLAQAENIINEADTDANGTLEFNEFVLIMVKHVRTSDDIVNGDEKGMAKMLMEIGEKQRDRNRDNMFETLKYFALRLLAGYGAALVCGAVLAGLTLLIMLWTGSYATVFEASATSRVALMDQVNAAPVVHELDETQRMFLDESDEHSKCPPWMLITVGNTSLNATPTYLWKNLTPSFVIIATTGAKGRRLASERDLDAAGLALSSGGDYGHVGRRGRHLSFQHISVTLPCEQIDEKYAGEIEIRCQNAVERLFSYEPSYEIYEDGCFRRCAVNETATLPSGDLFRLESPLVSVEGSNAYQQCGAAADQFMVVKCREEGPYMAQSCCNAGACCRPNASLAASVTAVSLGNTPPHVAELIAQFHGGALPTSLNLTLVDPLVNGDVGLALPAGWRERSGSFGLDWVHPGYVADAQTAPHDYGRFGESLSANAREAKSTSRLGVVPGVMRAWEGCKALHPDLLEGSATLTCDGTRQTVELNCTDERGIFSKPFDASLLLTKPEKECSAYPLCAAAGYNGTCCPGPSGMFKLCCDLAEPSLGVQLPLGSTLMILNLLPAPVLLLVLLLASIPLVGCALKPEWREPGTPMGEVIAKVQTVSKGVGAYAESESSVNKEKEAIYAATTAKATEARANAPAAEAAQVAGQTSTRQGASGGEGMIKVLRARGPCCPAPCVPLMLFLGAVLFLLMTAILFTSSFFVVLSALLVLMVTGCAWSCGSCLVMLGDDINMPQTNFSEKKRPALAVISSLGSVLDSLFGSILKLLIDFLVLYKDLLSTFTFFNSLQGNFPALPKLSLGLVIPAFLPDWYLGWFPALEGLFAWIGSVVDSLIDGIGSLSFGNVAVSCAWMKDL